MFPFYKKDLQLQRNRRRMVQIIATPEDNNMTSRRSMTGLLCGSMNMSSITSFGVITSGLELHQNYSKIEAKFTLPKEEVGEDLVKTVVLQLSHDDDLFYCRSYNNSSLAVTLIRCVSIAAFNKYGVELPLTANFSMPMLLNKLSPFQMEYVLNRDELRTLSRTSRGISSMIYYYPDIKETQTIETGSKVKLQKISSNAFTKGSTKIAPISKWGIVVKAETDHIIGFDLGNGGEWLPFHNVIDSIRFNVSQTLRKSNTQSWLITLSICHGLIMKIPRLPLISVCTEQRCEHPAVGIIEVHYWDKGKYSYTQGTGILCCSNDIIDIVRQGKSLTKLHVITAEHNLKHIEWKNIDQNKIDSIHFRLSGNLFRYPIYLNNKKMYCIDNEYGYEDTFDCVLLPLCNPNQYPVTVGNADHDHFTSVLEAVVNAQQYCITPRSCAIPQLGEPICLVSYRHGGVQTASWGTILKIELINQRAIRFYHSCRSADGSCGGLLMNSLQFCVGVHLGTEEGVGYGTCMRSEKIVEELTMRCKLF